tara:strand:- start:1825 stop:2427 length:603 start_codon:yes stop_codon:yes gene_type:complete
MNTATLSVLKTLVPYLVCFLMGILLGWNGCGGRGEGPITTVIKAPVPKIEYIDRWKTDTVRFVSRQIVHDTIHNTIRDTHLDTIFLVDTVSIVEAWLTEISKYDTTVTQKNSSIQLTWQNYQNRSENLKVTYTPKKVVGANFALGIHANVGLLSNFKDSYVPLMGVGLQTSIKKGYYGIDYGFNGEHYIGLRVGRVLISR